MVFTVGSYKSRSIPVILSILRYPKKLLSTFVVTSCKLVKYSNRVLLPQCKVIKTEAVGSKQNIFYTR